MKRLLLSAAFGMMATWAFAGITTDQLVALYQSQGYTSIEVKTGPTQMKVEAIQGSTKVEVIYDIATGAILKQENSTVSGASSSGVEIGSSSDDFLSGDDSDDSSDDDGDDDSGSDDDGSDDDGDDDSGSDDDGSDDDSGNDDSGDDDSNGDSNDD